MQAWEYCEVAWMPKQVIIRIYSSHTGIYEGIQEPEEWGALLAQLGNEGWEMVGIVPGRPANHALYYFKRAITSFAKEEWEGRKETLQERTAKWREQRAEQKKAADQTAHEETKQEGE